MAIHRFWHRPIFRFQPARLWYLLVLTGYGQPILAGIRLDDISLILQGVVPAAVLALLVQGLFALTERGLLPKGLHIQVSEPKLAR